MRINENVFFGHMPRYRQVAEIIKQEIANGKYQPHDILPSEPGMMEMYSVCRLTVRQALSVLLSERVIYKRQGKGTFVSEPLGRCECCGQILPPERQRKEIAQ